MTAVMVMGAANLHPGEVIGIAAPAIRWPLLLLQEQEVENLKTVTFAVTNLWLTVLISNLIVVVTR